MACAMEVLAWNSSNGSLTSIERVDLVPSNFKTPSTGSEVVFDRSGRFAYAAVRTYDRIVAYAVDPVSAKLTELDRASCGGKIPRHIAMDPTGRWLLVANQESDNIAVLSRDPQTGKLSKTSTSFPLVKPQCLVFL